MMIDSLITGIRYGLIGLGCLTTVFVGSAVVVLVVNVAGTQLINIFTKNDKE